LKYELMRSTAIGLVELVADEELDAQAFGWRRPLTFLAQPHA
jgi:hypothetical protein